MRNAEVASLLNEIADYLEFADDTFKVRSYRRAAQNIDTLSEDVEQEWKQGRLTEIPGIGEGIAKKIDEFLKNNKSPYLEKLKKETPVDLESLRKIEGLGPKRIMKIYRELGVKNVEELKNAAISKKIQSIEGFGP